MVSAAPSARVMNGPRDPSGFLVIAGRVTETISGRPESPPPGLTHVRHPHSRPDTLSVASSVYRAPRTLPGRAVEAPSGGWNSLGHSPRAALNSTFTREIHKLQTPCFHLFCQTLRQENTT